MDRSDADAGRISSGTADRQQSLARCPRRRSKGTARNAINLELEKAQEHVETLEARLAEIQQQHADLKAQIIDEADVAKAMEDFDELWSVLMTPERERILKLLATTKITDQIVVKQLTY